MINTQILEEAKNLEELFLSSMELENIDFLKTLTNLKKLTIKHTAVFGSEKMSGSFYHPIYHLNQLQYLDISFSCFSNQAIHLSENKALFDLMTELKYLNLRETNLTDSRFLHTIKSKKLLLNFMDNQIRLNKNECNWIDLVTKITLLSGEIMNIEEFIVS